MNSADSNEKPPDPPKPPGEPLFERPLEELLSSLGPLPPGRRLPGFEENDKGNQRTPPGEKLFERPLEESLGQRPRRRKSSASEEDDKWNHRIGLLLVVGGITLVYTAAIVGCLLQVAMFMLVVAAIAFAVGKPRIAAVMLFAFAIPAASVLFFMIVCGITPER
jgi:hypothetical protein